MATKSVSKSSVGRQAQLPLARAMKISMNSLKIRFWRSMVTAGGIFLGIAFLTTVLTQMLMQWPVAPKVDAGLIRLDGQVNGPGDFDAYNPLPFSAGKAEGISDEVLNSTKATPGNFSLTGIVQGKAQEARAIRNLARVNKEWEGLKGLQKDLPLYVDILGAKDIKVTDAVKAGIPQALADKAVVFGATIKGSYFIDMIRKDLAKIDPICVATALNKDISPAQAASAGIPHDLVVKVLATPPPAPAAPVVAMAATPAPAVPAAPPPPKPGTFRGSVLATVLAADPDLWDDSEAVSKLRKIIPIYADVATGKDVKVEDAVKVGFDRREAEVMAAKSPTFKGADMVDLMRVDTNGVKPICVATALDQDISFSDAARAGVPAAIAQHLAGTGKVFKGSALNDAIKAHPTWIKIWKARVKRYAIFNTVEQKTIDTLGKTCAKTLEEILAEGKHPDTKTADLGNIMIVNTDGRKIQVSYTKDKVAAGETVMASGDYIVVPDRNTKYRMLWLVAMSLLVCTVGITNSMLMAVTERFKEIGTMKCLGALDSFVVLLFLLESSMLGICASVGGWIIGFVSMVCIAGFTKGWDAVATMSGTGVFLSFVYCIFAGMFLTLCATIAPAIRAAKMPAAMALRSEI